MRNLIITSTARPQPDAYFGPAEKGFLDWDNLLWRFAAEKSYWVATRGAAPHSMPVWGVWQQAAFRFSTHPASRKAHNLRRHPAATVHLADTEAVLILECVSTEVTDTQQLQDFINEYNPKYRWQFSLDDVREGVFALTPRKAFAWAAGEGDLFHNTATRWTFDVREES